MNNKAKKKKQMMLLQSRRGVMLIALIAVTVLLINLITASYSWFTPQSEEKRGMSYSFTGKIRSEDCTMTTFVGTKVTSANRQEGEYINQIRYNGETTYTTSVSLAANTTNYFKTEVINKDSVNASDISLYATGLPACTLSVTYPANTVRTFSSAPGEIYIVRDAYVAPRDNAGDNSATKLVIEWFVTTGSTGGTVNLALLYN